MLSSAMWLEINFFQKNGFDNTQINNIVSKSPDVLFYKVDKTLQPKLVILQEIGLSSKDLYKFLMENYGFSGKVWLLLLDLYLTILEIYWVVMKILLRL